MAKAVITCLHGPQVKLRLPKAERLSNFVEAAQSISPSVYMDIRIVPRPGVLGYAGVGLRDGVVEALKGRRNAILNVEYLREGRRNGEYAWLNGGDLRMNINQYKIVYMTLSLCRHYSQMPPSIAMRHS